MDEKAIAFARAMFVLHRIVKGEVGVIEGCRRFLQSAVFSGMEQDDHYLTFVVVESETDALPIGKQRDLWEPGALAVKDQEVSSAESHYRESVLTSARYLLKKYSIE